MTFISSMALRLAAAAAVVCAISLSASPSALALDYPTKPVRLIVGVAPGGANDTVARLVAQALAASFYDNANVNFARDIAPVTSLVRGPLVMEVNPSFPARTIPEFIAYAKANPGKINMASAGIGNTTHVAGVLFMMLTGTKFTHVPYRGGAPAV